MKILAALVLLSGLASAEPRAEPEPRAALELDRDEELGDKKSQWLAEKEARLVVAHPTAPPPKTAEHPLSLRNLWVDEVVTLSPSLTDAEAQRVFDYITRCHFTQAQTQMAPALLPLVRKAAATFHAPQVEIVSGFRAPKYQLMLRKKGHEVARDSEHPKGEAVDFRLPNVPTPTLLAFVKKQGLGGVGFYPVSKFVHADVGPVRYWRGH